MRHSLFALITMFGLFLVNPAFAQDDPPAAVETEAAADAPEAEAPAADAPAEGGEEAPAAEGDKPEGEADAPAAEGDEKAEADKAEGDEKAEAPETDEEALETAMLLVDALKAGQWPLAVGLLLTLLVYGVNRFALKDKVGEKVIPWIAFGVGVAGAAGVGLATGVPILESLTEGALAGVAAVGGWEMALKHITAGKAAEEPKAEEPKAEEPKAE